MLLAQASLGAQTIKNLPAMWKTRVWSLGWEEPLKKEMATHSSILAWKIPWVEEPGRLQSIASQSVGHDWATNTLLCYWLGGKESACQYRKCRFSPWFGKSPWRGKWKPTLVFLPGKFHGQRSLAGYSLWGHKESDVTKHTCFYSHIWSLRIENLRYSHEWHEKEERIVILLLPLTHWPVLI